MNKTIKTIKSDDMDIMDVLDASVNETYVDYENREILIEGTIGFDAVQKYIIPIMQFNKQDDANNLPITERRPIKLYFSCLGGEVSTGLALYDIIKASKTPIMGIALSTAFSMGFLLYIACPYRLCYPHSTFLWHDGYSTMQNSGGKVRDTYEFLSITQEKMIKNIILANTKISARTLNKKQRNEWYITAEESVKLGISDEIINEIV